MWDFVIIGGGIAGLSAGAALAPLGRVLLLEAEAATGYHTSGRSAALYEPDYGSPATVAVSRASGAALAAMGVLSPRGLMLVAGADQAEAFAADVATLRLTPVPLSEARARVPVLHPEAVALAATSEAAQDIDTDAMMQHYARRLRATGGEIRTRARVERIEPLPQGWRLHLGEDRIDAAHVINAAGAWADAVAAMAGVAPLGIQPMRRSMAVIPAPAGQDVARWPMLMGVGETWYAKPQGGRLLVSPAEEEPVSAHDAWPEDMVLAEGLARYEAMVTTPVTRLEASWAGLRSFAPDRALVLGPDPTAPRFVWCAGQGGQGFQSAPAAAAVLAQTLGGPASGLEAAVLAALSPARFR